MALDAKLISRSNDPSHQEAPADADAVTTTAAAGPGQWQLLYFDAPTRGEQLRLLFRLAKQPFDDVRLVWPSGIAPYKHAALGDASPLLFDQCPMVTSPDGHHIAQTLSVARQESSETLEASLVLCEYMDKPPPVQRALRPMGGALASICTGAPAASPQD